MRLFKFNLLLSRTGRRAAAEQRRHILRSLPFPLAHKICMYTVLRRQLGKRQFPAQRVKRNTPLELSRIPRSFPHLRIVLLLRRSTLTSGPKSWDHLSTSLFAALDVKAGTIVGKCMPRHRATEFRKFLDEVERNVAEGLDVHIVMDNYGTHKTKLIRDWFAKRPRWHVHFTPTSASWINQVERFFALLTDRALRRGVFRSVAELEKAIEEYVAATNADPKPFRWTRTADDILASIQRFCWRTIDDNA